MPSNINVIVVGAGFGGLAAAIELTKKGCKVKVFEAVRSLDNKGAGCSFSQSVELTHLKGMLFRLDPMQLVS